MWFMAPPLFIRAMRLSGGVAAVDDKVSTLAHVSSGPLKESDRTYSSVGGSI
jgi:hypothetical protein